MTNYLISIIIPVYNNSHFLKDLLLAIHQQYDQQIEILIVNDGSTDRSTETLKDLQIIYPNIVIFEQANKGLSGARNTGISLSTGKYSIFLDPDDDIPINYFEILLESIKSNKDIYLFDLYISVTENERIYSFQGPYISNNKFIINLLSGNKHGSVCTKLIRNDIYSEFNIQYHLGISISEDLLVITRLLLQNVKVEYVNRPIYIYKMHNSQLTIKRTRDFFLESAKLNIELSKLIDKNVYSIYLLERKINLRMAIKKNCFEKSIFPYTFFDYVTCVKYFKLKNCIKLIYTSI